MVTKEGIITSTFENKVWVKTVRSKTCESCESHDSCETASKAQEMTIQLENSLNASIGDRVIVGFRTAPLLKVTFLLYIFPIILLIAGAAAGDALAVKLRTDPSITSLIAGLICFSIAFIVIRIINNAWAKKEEFQPYLMRLAGKAAASCPTSTAK